MRKRSTFAALAALTTLGLVVSASTAAQAAPASSTTTVGAYQQLRLERFGTGTTMSWQNTADSPLDTNTRALKTHVATDPDTSDATYYYADAYTRASIHLNKPVGAIHNLSFDYKTGQAGGGAPRISVIFGNGDVGYASAEYCAQPIATSGGTWTRADFTGSNTSMSAPCSFLVTGTTGGTYSSDASSSAWDSYVAAHPSQVVLQTFMVWDVAGDYTVDRLSLGTGFMFTKDNTHPSKCTTEAAC